MAVAEQFLPDIVFLELELPDGGGIPVARQLARDAHKRRPRLIALTKQPDDPMYDKARAAGFERLLVKPVLNEELDKILGVSQNAAGATAEPGAPAPDAYSSPNYQGR